MMEPFMKISIYDTAQRGKRPFIPIESGKVSMYVCGLTVYDLAHIGHARTFVTFDVIRRYLLSRGYVVKMVRNHTDVDDKIIRRAAQTGEPPQALAERMIKDLEADFEALGILPADVTPRVTESIPQIIAMTQTLIDKGHAYTVEGDVYFRVRSFPAYGKFAGRNLDELEAGARVEVDCRKESPHDFALWKAAKAGEQPVWESPWGLGRPGWHIECSAMSLEHLGPRFDIHGGGRDLIFPHHQNEVAQSCAATGDEFARYWMHVGMLEIDGEKMSHSLNNFWTARDVLGQVHAEALRYFFLTAQYRSNLNYSRENIGEATQRVAYLYRTLEAVEEALAKRADADLVTDMGAATRQSDLDKHLPAFHEAMSDDFCTPRGLAALGEAAKLANELAFEVKRAPTDPQVRALRLARAHLLQMGQALGLLTRPVAQTLAEITALELARKGIDRDQVEAVVAARCAARTQKDWASADRLRGELDALGVQVLDKPQGTTWRLEGI
jgi:cysteinyl-tRNA synthetase